MRRGAPAALIALVAWALAAPAAAYVRTTSETTAVPLAWPIPIVTYDLSSAPSVPSPTCAPGATRDPLEDAIRASFSTWEQGCTDLRLLYGGKIPELRTGLAGTAENVVIVRKGWCTQDPAAKNAPCMNDPDVDCGGIYGCYEDGGPADWDTVALTTVLYDPDTGRIFDADLELNGWDGVAETPLAPPAPATANPHGYYFTCDHQQGWSACVSYGEQGCFAFDVQNTVTHEVGHFIGLAHPCDDPGTPACRSALPAWETVPYTERTMYKYTSVGETSKRILSADDIAGVCDVYPKQSGGCGCGAGGAPGLVAALLALLALRRRVR